MRKYLLLLVMMIPMVSFAQIFPVTTKANERAEKKIETKYEKLTSSIGVFIRTETYPLAKLPIKGDWINEAEIREITDLGTHEKKYFLYLRAGTELDVEYIAYEDLIKIIDATSKLKQKSTEESPNSHFVVCRFITDDGMELGYMHDKKTDWFINLNGTVRIFKKDIDVDQVFANYKNAIDSFKAK